MNGQDVEAIRHASYQISYLMDRLVAENTQRSREAAGALEDALDLIDSAIRTLESDDYDDGQVQQPEPEEPPRVVDLMAALEASLAATKRTLDPGRTAERGPE